jgi:hypothetical protein
MQQNYLIQVAVEASMKDGNINIAEITIFQWALIRNSMTDDLT